MGGGMALLFAENGIEVSLEDPSEKAMDGIIEAAKKQGFGDKVKKYTGMSNEQEGKELVANQVFLRLQIPMPVPHDPQSLHLQPSTWNRRR
jgi:3-hydroxyacyl-CoA dehydrogenase